MVRHWLMKSEPGVYSIQDLARDGKTTWEGVRNYQARNLMRDQMQVGDPVLFYHSNAQTPGIAGIARVCREAYPDPTALDPAHTYFDPKATAEQPIWVRVDLQFVSIFPRFITLTQLKSTPALADMWVIRRGMRLSIQPVASEDFALICELGQISR